METKELTINDRVRTIIDVEEKGKRMAFSERITISPQQTSKLIRNGENVSQNIIGKILIAYPFVNKEWLINGTGQMKLSKSDMVNIETPEIKIPALSKRFAETIKELGVSKRELINKIPELTQLRLNNILTGKTEPSENVLSDLIKNYTKINAEYLTKGKGNTIIKGNERKKNGIISNPEILDAVMKQSELKTFTQLAEKLNITPQVLYKIRRGEGIISKKVAIAINKLYSDFSVNWLLTGNDLIYKKQLIENSDEEPIKQPVKKPVKAELVKAVAKQPVEIKEQVKTETPLQQLIPFNEKVNYKEMYDDLLKRYTKLVDNNQRLMEIILKLNLKS